jgi:hypothetical protein
MIHEAWPLPRMYLSLRMRVVSGKLIEGQGIRKLVAKSADIHVPHDGHVRRVKWTGNKLFSDVMDPAQLLEGE